MAPGRGFQKLGQPVPLSNLVALENSGLRSAAQTNVPLRFSLSSGEENGRSVACLRSTVYCSRVRSRFHSASDFCIGKALALAGAALQAEANGSRLAVPSQARSERRVG